MHFLRHIGQIKYRFHSRAFCSGSHKIGSIRAFAECQAERVNDNRLTSACFSSENIQPCPKDQIKSLNERKIRDMEFQ